MDIIDLKDYMDVRFSDAQKLNDERYTDMQKAVDLRTTAVQIAVDKAEASTSLQVQASKEYVDIRFDAVDIRFDAMQMAVNRSDEEMNHRLEGMNQFRAQLSEQASQFVTRGEFGITKDLSARLITREEFSAVRDQLLQSVSASKDINKGFVSRTEFDGIAKIVYIGLGGLAAIEFLFKFLIK